MEISEFVSKFQTHPVLFLGAGISKRYCERAYSWDDLLETIALELSGDDRLYLEFKNHAKELSEGCIFPKLASLLSTEIDNKLKVRVGPGSMLSDLEKNINAEFFAAVRLDQKASRLKIWVKILLSPLEVRAEKEDEITLFQEACKNVASIVTTNYDTFIEEKLKFSPLIGNDILLSNPYQSVYKIHGCLTNPSSIILTDEDYKQFDNRYELIQAQLISLFIHNPIIFMGYGIQDENIQKLLSRIFSYVTPESELGKRVADNFLCVQFEEGSENTEVVREVFHIQQAGAQIDISLNVLKTDDFASLYKALAKLQLPVEAIHLKRVEHAFLRIKLGGEIAVKLVGDLENVDNRELVLAIGPRDRIDVSLDKIYRATEAIQSYFEITEEFKSGMVILTDDVNKKMCFPAKGMAYVFPEMERKDELCKQQNQLLNKEFNRIQTISGCRSAHTNVDDILRDERIVASNKVKAIFYQVYKEEIALDDVRAYLYNRLQDSTASVPTDIRKLLCLYDVRKYSEEESSRESL
ncbi:SIR2-like domain protein [Porphyromonas sp. oral taxon 279 str. F0450]|uniref:SIR2 family protein n=1 Tax=Porphyromonas sp. oral taxon 279 TaxID=712438 RepID=UPI00027C4678|nr:SIR2 family protein [Porphyromonas sp. oral taxon 279]EJU16098.1 SIR2-like domain protein [Porphyromonas sp. oral taxon 279 str. F0450]